MIAAIFNNSRRPSPNSLRVRQRAVREAARAAGHFRLDLLEPRTLLSVTFATSDNFQPGHAAAAYAMAADSNGNVYAAGAANSLIYGVVREKFAGSSTWITIPGLDSAGTLNAITVNAAGDVYAAGRLFGGGWAVFEKPAGQSSFSTSPIDQLASGTAWGITTDAAGDVFTTGIFGGHWTVRKQTAGTGAFATVDDLQPWIGGNSNYAYGVTVVGGTGPSAGVYVVGQILESSPTGNINGQAHWFVRKSSDGGSNWATVDDFVADPASRGSEAYAVTSDLAGNVYVGGAAGHNVITGYAKVKGKQEPVYGDFTHWVVRKSATGGLNTWSDNDDFQLSPASTLANVSYVNGLGVDRAGNVYAAGASTDSSNVKHSIVRSNAGGSWQTVDNYQLVSGKGADAWGFTADTNGTLYAAGEAIGSDGVYHWIIRTAAGPAALIVQAAPTLQPAAATTTSQTISPTLTSIATSTPSTPPAPNSSPSRPAPHASATAPTTHRNPQGALLDSILD